MCVCALAETPGRRTGLWDESFLEQYRRFLENPLIINDLERIIAQLRERLQRIRAALEPSSQEVELALRQQELPRRQREADLIAQFEVALLEEDELLLDWSETLIQLEVENWAPYHAIRRVARAQRLRSPVRLEQIHQGQ